MQARIPLKQNIAKKDEPLQGRSKIARESIMNDCLLLCIYIFNS